jgi:VanZ family protein
MINPITVWRLAFWLATLVVTIASLSPSDALPSILFVWWDKAEHVLAYAALAFAGWWAYSNQRAVTMTGLVLFGGALEITQSASGLRTGDLIDWLADAIGVAVGFLVAGWLTKAIGGRRTA